MATTTTGSEPRDLARSKDKKRVRLNTVSHLLNHTHYDAIPAEKVMLPRRKIGRYKTGDDTFRYIPQRH